MAERSRAPVTRTALAGTTGQGTGGKQPSAAQVAGWIQFLETLIAEQTAAENEDSEAGPDPPFVKVAL